MSVFWKLNMTSYSDALIREAEGLHVLRSAIQDEDIRELNIPQVFEVNHSELQVQKIKGVNATEEQMITLGTGLARLHKRSGNQFGLDQDNYIGLNPQVNTWTCSWGEFFVARRLAFQISKIEDNGVKQRFEQILDGCSNSLVRFLDQHCAHASLVHGDLWLGNVLFDEHDVWLIDPAIYFGDREVDIAMTEMFGGFSSSFYQSYDREYCRSDEYDRKKVIYNLYHFLNHYNLFGNSYINPCLEGFEFIQTI